MIAWIAVLLSITGIILNARKSIWCWYVWIMSNILWIGVALQRNDLPLFAVWASFIVANFYGWYEWYQASQGTMKPYKGSPLMSASKRAGAVRFIVTMGTSPDGYTAKLERRSFRLLPRKLISSFSSLNYNRVSREFDILLHTATELAEKQNAGR